MSEQINLPAIEEAVKFLAVQGHFDMSDALIELISGYIETYKKNLELRYKVETLSSRLYLNGINHNVETTNAE